MKKLTIITAIVQSIILASCCSYDRISETEYCRTEYPVVLVHGVAFRDKTVMLNYWGKTPECLKKNGAVVYTGGQDAFGTVPENAELLKKKVLSILSKTGAGKVNTIAHSRGGIEARYMISMLGMSDRIASMTSVATPHRGSSMADLIMNKIPEKNYIPGIVNFYAKIIGDSTPESYNACLELTRESMKKFNSEIPDMPGVYYQSYAGAIDDSFRQGMWREMYKTIKKHEGENDGLVSVDSAKWGNFRGVVNCGGRARVSHADIIGMHFISEEYCFDSADFYVQMVHELKMNGY